MPIKFKKPIPEVGEVVGRLTITSEPFMSVKESSGRKLTFVNVTCSCNGAEFKLAVTEILAGRQKSCGCIKKEAAYNKTHQMSRERIYRIWADMKKRCDNPNHVKFNDYGGRGIKYDPSWVYFENFRDHMMGTYEESLELDRVDPNGDYTPENCRWTDRSVNCHNRRKRKGSMLQTIGVCIHGKGYRATLYKEGKKIFSKTFSTEEEAAIAYDNISEEIYGDRPNNTKRE